MAILQQLGTVTVQNRRQFKSLDKYQPVAIAMAARSHTMMSLTLSRFFS
jgi:hypothetical protein